MTEEEKKVWKVMVNDLGWERWEPVGHYLIFFQHTIRAVKKVIEQK